MWQPGSRAKLALVLLMAEITAVHQRMFTLMREANQILAAHSIPAKVTSLSFVCDDRLTQATITYADDNAETCLIATAFLYPITIAESVARFYLFRLDSIREQVDDIPGPVHLPTIASRLAAWLPGHCPFEDEPDEPDEIDTDPRINSKTGGSLN